MRLTVLGNNGPYPSVGGACSGYLLTSEKTRLLIECGSGVLARLRGICSPDRLDAVLLSHLHYDHMSDLLPMQYALQFCPPRDKLPIFAPEEPEAVRRLLDAPCYRLMPMQDVKIGDMSVRFYPVRHPVLTYALRIEAENRVFVYTGDTNTADGLSAFCQDADLLLADAGLNGADWNPHSPHLSAELCGELAQSASVKHLLLTHFNPKYDPQQLLQEAKAAFDSAELAQIGAEYML